MIGSTPLVRIDPYGIYAKLEWFNQTGSVKDRPALFMLMGAMSEGKLEPGGTVVEATSGNTGIALAAIGTRLGMRVIITMPDSVSKERAALIRQYGGDVVLTPGDKGMRGAMKKAEEIAAETRAYMPKQFDNPYNPLAHEMTTGSELVRQMEFAIDAFVAGVGTGGTITGVGRALRKFFGQRVFIVAVEPAGSPVLSGGPAGRHQIQGIGPGFVPSIFDQGLIDRIIAVTDEEALEGVKVLNKLGFSVGISSGANFMAALRLKEKRGFSRVATIFPDDGSKYVSVLG
ncbi:cysteine synthase family protein [Coprothermobacteraceae bacterium]|nr:cysteine synthase family protein [Coprothermobacteraceae bacterium]